MTDTAAATTTWAIDPAHSAVEFAVKHMMFTTAKGRFQEFSGTITFDEQHVENSNVQVTVQTASITTSQDDRDAHLRSGDFFAAEEYPEATYQSTSIESRGGNDFRIIGDLTLKSVTEQVTLDATFQGTGTNPWGQQVAGFEAKGSFSRKAFGLSYNQALEGGGVLVGDEVKINLEIQAGAATS
jgi:polyisoprenoid-binding protein YceI